MTPQTWQIIAMVIYFAGMIALGLIALRRTSDLGDYMLGGRSLHPGVAALSAGASDMSGWLLMGLPGALYLNGLVELWIAIGLTVGAWLNWMFVAPRLRSYTEVANDSITVPSFLENRLRDRSRMIRIVSGLIILVFFTFYVSSGMVAGGTFFQSSFGMNYHFGMLLVSGIVVVYTLMGGFLAVSWTDTVQGTMMLIALILVPIVGIIHLGGFDGWKAGIDQVTASGEVNLFSMVTGVSVIAVASNIAWGLGYFGQPHIIVRFMALRNPGEAKQARRIGMSWMVLSLVGAAATAFVGIAIFQHDETRLANPETVFLAMGQLLFHPLVGGLILAAVLAAIMSTISSQLLVSSSALIEDIYRGLFKKQLSPGRGVMVGRISVLIVAVVAAVLAWDPQSNILTLVGFAWGGFGAAFGPLILLALFWRKLTWQGALTGMIAGALTVFVWKYVLAANYVDSVPIFGLYEIVPGFLVNLVLAVAISFATYRHNEEVQAEFDAAVDATR